MKNKILFSNEIINRCEKTRNKINKLTDFQKKNTRHIIYWKSRFLFDSNNKSVKLKIFNNLEDFSEIFKKSISEKNIFLGSVNDINYFCHDFSDVNFKRKQNVEEKIYFSSLKESYIFHDLKRILSSLSQEDANLIAISKSILEWNNENNFCSKCGYKLSSLNMGWLLKCSKCDFKSFPRIDPVVIMLIKNKENILLARSKDWPEGMFSCPAGFMEPGETIEDAVRRETMEEVGIEIKNIKYLSSQPWPFSYSLMIGCSGDTKKFNIKIDHNELEDARWFSKKEIKKALKGESNWFPARKGAIARNLISRWVKGK